MTDINLSAVARVLGWHDLKRDDEGNLLIYRKQFDTGPRQLSDGDLLLALLEAMSERGLEPAVKRLTSKNYHCYCYEPSGKGTVSGTGPTWLEAVMRCAEKIA